MPTTVTRTLRSANARTALLLFAALAVTALSTSSLNLAMDTGTFLSGGAATHVAGALHIPYALALAGVELLATGGTIAACFAFAFICPIVAWVYTLIAQIGIAAAAYA